MRLKKEKQDINTSKTGQQKAKAHNDQRSSEREMIESISRNRRKWIDDLAGRAKDAPHRRKAKELFCGRLPTSYQTKGLGKTV